MKNYSHEEVSLTFNPFHESNDNTSLQFSIVKTDVFKDRGETLVKVTMDRDDIHDYRNNALTEFVMEEAQARQLNSLLSKHFK